MPCCINVSFQICLQGVGLDYFVQINLLFSIIAAREWGQVPSLPHGSSMYVWLCVSKWWHAAFWRINGL